MSPYEHVYLHVPFCRRRCSYCDFSIAVRPQPPVAAYTDAIMAELATRGVGLDLAKVQTIYLGGGTPSQLGGEGIIGLFHGISGGARVGELSTRNHPIEITLEANPEDITPEAAAAWVAAGVNRVSLGVQSFHGPTLEWMHRGHRGGDIPAKVEELRRAGISNISLDLIFAVPESLGRDWGADLSAALALEPEHLSVYGLTVEPGTPLGRWTARGEVVEAPEERYEREFLEADRRLTAAGYEHYEVSNYGRPGRHSVHNGSYWRAVPYLGLGPSAHGFDGRVRRWNARAYAEWLRLVSEGRDPLEGSEALDAAAREAEAVYLGLRTVTGLRIRPNEEKTVMQWTAAGWGTLDGDRLALTPAGWLRLDSIAASLTSLRSRS